MGNYKLLFVCIQFLNISNEMFHEKHFQQKNVITFETLNIIMVCTANPLIFDLFTIGPYGSLKCQQICLHKTP